MRRCATALLATAAWLGGCAVGTDYQRPETELPATHRGATADSESIADRDWRQVFTEAPLQALIEEALRAGPDALLAAARVREAEAVARSVRAGSLPSVGVSLSTSPVARRSGDTLTSSYLGGITASWELDLWGRYARATEGARADLMARQASRDAINASLVANTAALYYQLRGLRDIEAVTQRAVASQLEVLRLVRRLSQAGVSSAAEERQQENAVANTEARLPVIERQIAAVENALAVLVGRAPSSLAIEAPALLGLPSSIPAGLPSQLLQRRPDILQAEAQLRAANARVGEAKALFYPNISLTAALGTVSTSLSDVLLLQGATVASLGPALLQPLYNGGALRANEDATLARLDQSLISYRKTVLTALGEVADGLNAYNTQGKAMEIQRRRAVAASESMRLADKRFRAGVAGFLEVLNAQQQLLSAETDEVQTLLDRRLALVQVYLALGGGWSAQRS